MIMYTDNIPVTVGFDWDVVAMACPVIACWLAAVVYSLLAGCSRCGLLAGLLGLNFSSDLVANKVQEVGERAVSEWVRLRLSVCTGALSRSSCGSTRRPCRRSCGPAHTVLLTSLSSIRLRLRHGKGSGT